MPKINLDDFSPPLFHSDPRCFILDTESKEVAVENLAKNETSCRHSCGFGSTATLIGLPPRQAFVAVYVSGRSINLWFHDKELTLTPEMTATISWHMPLINQFQLLLHGERIASLLYLNSGDPDEFPITDLFKHITQIVCNDLDAKRFAYIWSASAIGRKRAYGDFGLSDETIRLIVDPYDPLVDY
jgi:hypothetical protein